MWLFAGMPLVEIGIAVYKKLMRKRLFIDVVARGRNLCVAGVIPVKAWNAAAIHFEEYREKKTSLMAAMLAHVVDPLLF